MGFFNKEVELTVPPKKQNTNNKTIKIKPLSGYDAMREKIDSENTLTGKRPVVTERTKPKVRLNSRLGNHEPRSFDAKLLKRQKSTLFILRSKV